MNGTRVHCTDAAVAAGVVARGIVVGVRVVFVVDMRHRSQCGSSM